jgi:hypothetical protein
VYLCGEGYHGIARRLQAIEAHHRLGLADGALVVSKVGASFLSFLEVAQVKAAIERVEERFGPMVLLIVDTLARFISPGDESKAQDMGAYLNAVEALRVDATAITLHHPGHGDAQRGRGSSAWRGGVDAEFTLASANDVITVTCQKMKDGEKPAPFSFKVTPAPTKLCREDGSPVNSVVIVPTNTENVMARPSGKNQAKLLAELERRDANDVAWTDNELRTIAREIGMDRQRAREAVIGLRNLGYLVGTVGGSHLPHMRTNERKSNESTDSDETRANETARASIEARISDASSVIAVTTSEHRPTCRKCGGEGCERCEPRKQKRD